MFYQHTMNSISNKIYAIWVQFIRTSIFISSSYQYQKNWFERKCTLSWNRNNASYLNIAIIICKISKIWILVCGKHSEFPTSGNILQILVHSGLFEKKRGMKLPKKHLHNDPRESRILLTILNYRRRRSFSHFIKKGITLWKNCLNMFGY